MAGKKRPTRLGRWRTVGLALFVLVVASAFVPTGVSAAPDDPCNGIEGPKVVALFQTGERIDPETPLYPGTKLLLYVCEDGGAEAYGAAWKFDESAVPGLEVEESPGPHLLVSVTNRSEEITPAAAVQRKPDIEGPEISVQTGFTTTQRIGSENVTLRFGSEGDRDSFSQSATQFRANTSEATAAAANLSNRESSALLADPSSRLSTIRSADVAETGRRLEHDAFAAASVSSVEAVAEVVQLTQSRETEVRTSVREDLRAYVAALETRERTVANTVRLVFGGTLLGGLVGGGVLGYWLSRRTIRKVEADRSVSTATQYSLKHVGLPIVIGAVALVTALVALALGGGRLFEVIL